MKNQNRKTIGYVTPFIWGDISLSYFRGALEVAKNEDMNIICYIGQRLEDTKDFNYQANAIYNHMDSGWMDGLVVWASQIGELLPPEKKARLDSYFPQVPMVTMAGRIGNHPYILTDDDVSIFQLVNHLVDEHGYKRIGFVRGPKSHALAEGRYHAFKLAMERRHLSVEDQYITGPEPFVLETGTKAMNYYENLWPGKVPDHIDAIICSSDAFAKTLSDRAKDLGYIIPRDFGLVGINNKAESQLSTPPLTTIDPQIEEVGYLAFQTLVDQLQGKGVPLAQFVDPILTIRKSCGCTENDVQRHYKEGDLDLKFLLDGSTDEAVELRFKSLIKDLIKGSMVQYNDSLMEALIFNLKKSFETQDTAHFCHFFTVLLNDLKDSHEHLDIWEMFLTQISARVVNHIEGLDTFKFFMNMMNRCRLEIASAVAYQLAGTQYKIDQMLKSINQTNAALRTAHEYNQVMGLFANLLPELGIPACYVVLYDEGSHFKHGRVTFAYKDGHTLDASLEESFQTKWLLPEHSFTREKAYCLFAQSLYYREDLYGYILFEAGPIDKSIYQILATELSGALYRSLLFSSLVEVEKEREHLLHALEERNANLERRIEERTRDIREVNRQLEIASNEAKQANEAKSQFLANISHEIRTPLNCIIGFADMIQAISKDETISRYIELTIEETEKLLLLINQLLDLSKIESGKLQLNMEPLSIDKVMESLASTYSVVAEAKGLKYEYYIDPSVPRIFKGDALRLRQVLVNLIGNAIKFTQNGGIKVVVKASTMDDQGIRLYCDIQDSGIGIDNDRLEHIFKVFEQESSSTSKFYGGTGLGTTISKQLVELMGGKIWVESVKNVGSTFHFNIPIEVMSADEKEAYDKEDGNHSPAMVHEVYPKAHILIVEDYPPNRMLAIAYLGALECKVSIATNGKEALDLVKDHTYDLVLMDVQMPIMDGVEATKMIRQLKTPKDLTIIGMTANAYESDLVTYREIGMNDVVTKPFRKTSLLNVVSKWLGGKQVAASELYQSMDMRAGLPYNHSQMLRELDGDEGLLDELLSDFVHHTRLNLVNLSEAIEEERYDEIHAIAHTIKGAALNMTANIIGELSLAIEQDAKNQYFEELPQLLRTLKEQFEAFNHYLEQPIDERMR